MSEPIPSSQRQVLRQMSTRLLGLHKILLDQERARYEQSNGPISSTGEYLNLVLGHEQFEWLRKISGVIVQIDELLGPRSKSGSEDADAVERAVRDLLVPDERGNPFQRLYWEALQRSPEALTTHGEILAQKRPLQNGK